MAADDIRVDHRAPAACVHQAAHQPARVDQPAQTDQAARAPMGPPGTNQTPQRWLSGGGLLARRTLIGAALAAYAWVAGGTLPFSSKALVSVLLPGAVLGVIAYGRPPERIPAPESVDLVGFSYWVICIAVLFEWEAAAFKDGSPGWHPSLTALINPLLAPHPVKSSAVAIWLLAGWALVRR